MEHLGTKTIETERLILRRFVISDAQNMFDNYCSREKVTEFMTWSRHGSVEDTKSYLTECVLSEYDKKDYYHWAVVWKETNEVIGSIGVCENKDEKRRVEIGWCIGDDYWGRGIMPEAARHVVAFLFSVGYERIQATHHIDNRKSGRVMEKIGMQYEGILKKYNVDKNNNLVDSCIYAIVKPK